MKLITKENEQEEVIYYSVFDDGTELNISDILDEDYPDGYSVYEFDDKYLKVESYDEYYKREVVSLIDYKGNCIIADNYSIEKLKCGKYLVLSFLMQDISDEHDEENLYHDEYYGEYNAYLHDGKSKCSDYIKIDTTYEYLLEDFGESIVLEILMQNNKGIDYRKKCLCDTEDFNIICLFEDYETIEDGYLIVSLSLGDKCYGLINFSRKEKLLDIKYHNIEATEVKNIFKVSIKEIKGYQDFAILNGFYNAEKMEFIIEPIYDSIIETEDDSLYIVSRDDKKEIIDLRK